MEFKEKSFLLYEFGINGYDVWNQIDSDFTSFDRTWSSNEYGAMCISKGLYYDVFNHTKNDTLHGYNFGSSGLEREADSVWLRKYLDTDYNTGYNQGLKATAYENRAFLVWLTFVRNKLPFCMNKPSWVQQYGKAFGSGMMSTVNASSLFKRILNTLLNYVHNDSYSNLDLIFKSRRSKFNRDDYISRKECQCEMMINDGSFFVKLEAVGLTLTYRFKVVHPNTYQSRDSLIIHIVYRESIRRRVRLRFTDHYFEYYHGYFVGRKFVLHNQTCVPGRDVIMTHKYDWNDDIHVEIWTKVHPDRVEILTIYDALTIIPKGGFTRDVLHGTSTSMMCVQSCVDYAIKFYIERKVMLKNGLTYITSHRFRRQCSSRDVVASQLLERNMTLSKSSYAQIWPGQLNGRPLDLNFYAPRNLELKAAAKTD